MAFSRQKLQWLLSLLLCALLLLPLLPSADAQELPKQGRLTVKLEHTYADNEKRTVSNVSVGIYPVATMEESGDFTATEAFSGFQSDFRNAQTDKAWQTLTPILRSWVREQEIYPADVRFSDADGLVTFDSLKPGLFLLVIGEGVHPDYPSTRVGFQNTLVSVPYRGNATENMLNLEDPTLWDYDYMVIPKPFEGHEIDRIQKIWEDKDDAYHHRPDRINVEITYEDGIVQTLELNAENGWLLEFEPASLTDVISMQEPNQPEAYFIQGFGIVGTTVQLTNELKSSYMSPGDETPTEPTGPTEPTRPTQPTQPTRPTNPDKPSLPQTGQLWWPVPVLFVAGVVLILLGVLRRRSAKKHEDDEAP